MAHATIETRFHAIVADLRLIASFLFREKASTLKEEEYVQIFVNNSQKSKGSDSSVKETQAVFNGKG